MAQKLGYFDEAGLDVSIQTPSDPAAPIKLVAAGQTDLAISYEPEVMLAREQGLDVVAVGALVNRPLTSMIWLKKSGIKGVADLRGKTIATAGIPYQDAYLKTILARANLSPADVKTVNVGFGLLPALARRPGRRRCSAASATSRASTCACAARTRSSPRSTSSACRPTTSSSWSPSASSSKKTREAIRLFLAALARGTAAAVEEPGGGDQGAARGEPRPRPEADQGRGGGDAAAARAARAGSPTATWTRPSGATFIGWMRDNGLIAVAAGDRRRCSATTTCRARSPSRAASPSPSRAEIFSAGSAREKRWPWA